MVKVATLVCFVLPLHACIAVLGMILAGVLIGGSTYSSWQDLPQVQMVRSAQAANSEPGQNRQLTKAWQSKAGNRVLITRC